LSRSKSIRLERNSFGNTILNENEEEGSMGSLFIFGHNTELGSEISIIENSFQCSETSFPSDIFLTLPTNSENPAISFHLIKTVFLQKNTFSNCFQGKSGI
jgi:hypothetical protein